MDYLPISLAIKNKPCLVVGGGNIALRKAKQLLKAGADLTIVAMKFHPEIELMSVQSLNKSEGADSLSDDFSPIKLVKRAYQASDVLDKLVVIAATNDLSVNGQVYKDAEQHNVLVNVVDQPELCRFITPSVIDRSPLTIAISTGGSGPVFARMLREKIEWWLPKNIGRFLAKVNQYRPNAAKRFPDFQQRKRFWEGLFESVLGWEVSTEVADAAPENIALDDKMFELPEPDKGLFVWLIDRGNGDNEYLTVATIKALQKADCVYLSPESYRALRNLVRRDADVFQIEESEITNVLVATKIKKLTTPKAFQVVFLKGGHYFEDTSREFEISVSQESNICIRKVAAVKTT
jgi:uroporphyrin-III C-methyltransferase/precorrin-2 dehydrogenase/sirohydrochlorin ferrochelatase